MGGVIGVIIAGLGLGGAIQNFFVVPLPWKLFGIAMGTAVVVWFTVCRLANWVKPTRRAGFSQISSSRSRSGIAISAVILLVLCLILSSIAIATIHFNTISVQILAVSNAKTELWVRGAVQGTDRLTIQLPSPTHTTCAPIDPAGGSRYRTDVVIVDWNTSNPQLQLSNFFYPQRLGLRCMSPIDLNRVTVRAEPPSTEVFSPDRTRCYNSGIFLLGGVLWIVALVFLYFRSR